MSKPCASNDNFDPSIMNSSNDHQSWNLLIERGGGSGCPENVDVDGVTDPEEAINEAIEETTDETTGETIDETTGEVTEDETAFTKAELETAPADEPASFLSCNSANAEELAEAGGVERVDLAYDYEIHMNEEA
eukprot:CAMPEP_0172572314 /NCGR_PEP_ID=MMETSP1067-20121228/134663_1 /TAXON_ID=265564 ORGANISM="Thalassiosira punctigera, Strain Tpunct2005C2" /NCGR_SAMPLE_ID=MMETSP1067 /ASSEMBLY_ACC=CAM_ASM_000444 /LENGTH=133 /DNA_ID=CAMNT_0013364831 /DNA_START=8 /DNA_END=406 /DNA_ORIENTATION=+